MLERPLRRALLLGLLGCLALTSCGRGPFRKKPTVPTLAPAANPAVAAATKFSVNIVETDVNRRGTIVTGSIVLDAPLARATSGTYSLSPAPANTILAAGKDITDAFAENSSGKIAVTHSGNLSILEFFTKDGDSILKVIGPPNGNAIQDHWFYLGADCGLATVTPHS